MHVLNHLAHVLLENWVTIANLQLGGGRKARWYIFPPFYRKHGRGRGEAVETDQVHATGSADIGPQGRRGA